MTNEILTDGAFDVQSIPNPGNQGEESDSGAESVASAGAGSTGALDWTDEDFTREQASSTGFIGKTSEVTWLQRLRQENKHEDIQSDLQGNKR